MAFLGGFNTPMAAAVDADGDGDLDLFVQEINSKIGYYERTARRTACRTSSTGPICRHRRRPMYRFADVDRDGDLDLLTEQPFSYIKYYRNDGEGRAAQFRARR